VATPTFAAIGQRRRFGSKARVAKSSALPRLARPISSISEADALRSISAQDVNEYLRRISGATITSKDFRTWGATVCVAAQLAGAGRAETKAQMRRYVRDAINTAARVLGNTPAVCKRSYIDPAVFTHYEAGTKFAAAAIPGLRKPECVWHVSAGLSTPGRVGLRYATGSGSSPTDAWTCRPIPSAGPRSSLARETARRVRRRPGAAWRRPFVSRGPTGCCHARDDVPQ
jgi:hypothetical protein